MSNSNIETVATFPKACAAGPSGQTCDGHGSCDQSSYSCTCSPTYYGEVCSNKCIDCGLHGKCNDGASGDGKCGCAVGWADCENKGCVNDVSTDNNNCGACGVKCSLMAGDASATCSVAKCKVYIIIASFLFFHG